MNAHPIAVCRWCGSAFVKGTVLDLQAWLCPTKACWERQVAGAMVTTVKGRPRHDRPSGNRHCRFVPLPIQVDLQAALEGPAVFVLVGGAAGGTKSRGLREIAHRTALTTPHCRVLLLRRTYKQLADNHLRDVELEAPDLGAQWVPSANVLRYPNGSLLGFGHCETTADAANYLSSEYDLIIFDELVTFEETQFLLIASRARTTKPGVVPKVLAGTNPGGPQSAWVRRRFLDQDVDRDAFPDYRPEEWAFLPSKLEDNPYLDASYERKLAALPPALRKAYRDGDWDIFPGQYFPEWRKATHVAELQIPDKAVWYRAIDGGFIKPASVLWIAMWDGHAYVRHEWEPVRTINSKLATGIAEQTRDLHIYKVRETVADTSLWVPEKDTGESAAETFARYGIPLVQATKQRVNGWKRLREWLEIAPDGRPWLQVHPSCTYLIRSLPSLISDESDPEDIDTDGDDHAADALRYFVMARPAVRDVTQAPVIPVGSPAWVMAQIRAKSRRGFGRVA